MKTMLLFSRVLPILVILGMLLSLAACAAYGESVTTASPSNEMSATTTSPEEAFDPLETLPDVTYGFEDFYFWVRDLEESLADLAVQEITETSTSVDRAVFERNLNIQERLEITFVFHPLENNSFSSTIGAAIKSGDQSHSVAVGMGKTIFQGIFSNHYADWNDLEYVDLDAKWWNQSAREQWTTNGGKLYAMNGDLSYMGVGNNHSVFFNKKILQDAGITLPYDHVYADTWTQETFFASIKQADASMIHTDTNDIKTDTFGYATERYRGVSHVFPSTGCSSLIKDADGKLSLGYKNELCNDAFSRLLELLFESGTSYYGDKSTSLDDIRSAFSSGTVAFTDDNVKCAIMFKSTEIDYGLVPYPKANENVKQYYSMVGAGTNTFAVIRALTPENLSRASAVLEALAVYGHVDVIPYYYETLLSYQAMKDEHSLNMLHIIHDVSYFDLGGYANFGNLTSVGRYIISQPGTYGQSVFTAYAVLEPLIFADMKRWYALDEQN